MTKISKVKFDEPKQRLAVALDFESEKKATEFLSVVKDRVKVLKVGLELYSAAGPALVLKLIDMGYEVFVDLKLHDIPNTVYRAAKVLGKMGVKYTTAHAAGGKEMLVSANEGFLEGYNESGADGPCYMLGVSVLTSDPASTTDLLKFRVKTIREANLSGLVCSGSDLEIINRKQNSLFKVVPGIRLSNSNKDDQIRVTTPDLAVELGASMIVVGRPITLSPDPIATVEEILELI